MDAAAGDGDAFWERYADALLPQPAALTLPLCWEEGLLRELQHGAIEAAALAQQVRIGSGGWPFVVRGLWGGAPGVRATFIAAHLHRAHPNLSQSPPTKISSSPQPNQPQVNHHHHHHHHPAPTHSPCRSDSRGYSRASPRLPVRASPAGCSGGSAASGAGRSGWLRRGGHRSLSSIWVRVGWLGQLVGLGWLGWVGWVG